MLERLRHSIQNNVQDRTAIDQRSLQADIPDLGRDTHYFCGIVVCLKRVRRNENQDCYMGSGSRTHDDSATEDEPSKGQTQPRPSTRAATKGTPMRLGPLVRKATKTTTRVVDVENDDDTNNLMGEVRGVALSIPLNLRIPNKPWLVN